MPGRLIVFEGIDGSGKSTHAGMLREALGNAELHREPGGTKLGEDVRKILLSHRSDEMSVETEFLLYMSARAQLLEEAVRPALQAGKTVILDRYFYSTAAYQGAGRDYGSGKVLEICARLAFEVPDHVFVLDLDPEEAFKRLPTGKDRIESRGIAYFRKVRDEFLHLASHDKQRFTVLDASRPVKEVQLDIQGVMEQL